MTEILCKRNLGDIDKFEEFIDVEIPQRYLDFDELENHIIRKNYQYIQNFHKTPVPPS